MRLSFLFLGILIEVSMVALFYNLSGDEEESPPFLWEGLVEGIWVGVYSTLFSTLPMLLLALVYCLPTSRIASKLEQAKPIEKQAILSELAKQIRCRAVVGAILFFLLSGFFCLYLVAFCHVASEGMAQDWLVGS